MAWEWLLHAPWGFTDKARVSLPGPFPEEIYITWSELGHEQERSQSQQQELHRGRRPKAKLRSFESKATFVAYWGGRDFLAETSQISRSSQREQSRTPGLKCGATPTESTASLCLLDQEGEIIQGPRSKATQHSSLPTALRLIIQGTTRGRHAHKCHRTHI
jgi:hypothetical protein